MKTGIGIVTCGNCRRSTPVIWPGKKFKMPCPTCRKTMNIHRQRLKSFKTIQR